MLLGDVALLNEHIDNLLPNDRDFASSLIKQSSTRKGGLSDKQMYWVGVLLGRANPSSKPEENMTNKIQIGEFKNVIDLFLTAKAYLKYPKVRLCLEDKTPVVLSMAGDRSRAPGTINVVINGAWYGRVDQNGIWHKVHALMNETALITLLTELSKNPVGVAQSYGKLTGNCCFCAKPLSDPRSTATGYGATCAKHYNLPWGEVRSII